MSVADAPDGIQRIFGKEVCGDFAKASKLEWLDTNHTSAFAMGTVAQVNTRRYHSLLIATLHPPADRFSTLARIEETVRVGGNIYELATVQYPGTVQPSGFRLLEEFRVDPLPEWRFRVNGVEFRKTVCLIDRQQAVLVRYECSQACNLSVRLLLAFRDYHSLTHRNDEISTSANVERNHISFTPYADRPPLTILHSGGTFVAEAKWYLNHEYLRELERGLDFREDLCSPGLLEFEVTPQHAVWFVATLEPDLLDRQPDIDSLLENERARRRFASGEIAALDQFRFFRHDGMPSLIAGYPWFTDWGRDTLISLPALTIAGFPQHEIQLILSMLLTQRSQGLTPNRFLDQGAIPEYNTVDATLWLFVAAREYLLRTGDRDFLKQVIYPAACDIIEWHYRGTFYGIRVDLADHLLNSGEPGTQLTWMDAKIDGHVVTPRMGKAVEVNALWYNALQIAANWAQQLELEEERSRHLERAALVKDSFERKFWNSAAGSLYDVVSSDGDDARIRPNQLFAVSLPFPLLDRERGKAIVELCRDQLLTPVGLRTLARNDPSYRPRFEGDMRARDAAYHQGTVWPWLMGPYISAYLYSFGRVEEALTYCRNLLNRLETEMDTCCIGSISEVYDGEAPQRPSGCPAQLWSVAQLICAREMINRPLG